MTELRSCVKLLGAWVIAAWVVEAIDVIVLGRALDAFGIRPLDPWGLVGIPLSPLLHNGFGHLGANTVPFAVLGGLVLFGPHGDFLRASLTIILIGGLGVWVVGDLFGPGNTVHIGASGLIFGYFGFLLARGFYARTFKAALIAVGVAVIYGGLVFGVLPGQDGVSWQAHLCGFLAGILAARRLSVPGRKTRETLVRGPRPRT